MGTRSGGDHERGFVQRTEGTKHQVEEVLEGTRIIPKTDC